MGYPPSQGHNNLRLYHTTNFHHQHYTHRLDTKHYQHSRRLNQYHHRINALKILTEKSRLYAGSSGHFSADRNRAKLTRPTSLFKQYRGRLHRSQPALSGARSTVRRKLSRHSLPMLSNFPLIDDSTSMLLVNHSPFGLRDLRFGILHHCPQSASYF